MDEIISAIRIWINLSKEWGGTTVILSPRDISPAQLKSWTGAFKKSGIKTVFDPQMYFPKDIHKGLLKYEYWDSSFITHLDSSSTYEENLIGTILKYNEFIQNGWPAGDFDGNHGIRRIGNEIGRE